MSSQESSSVFVLNNWYVAGLAADIAATPLARMGANRTLVRTISLVVGCVSIGLGVAWGYPLTSRLLSN